MSAELLMLLVFSLAFLSPFISRTFGLPVPVGELILGLGVGYLIGGGTTPEILSFLSEFGFILLMFLAGMEIDFNLLEGTSKRRLYLYTAYVLGIFGSSVAIGMILGLSPVVSLILSMISVGLMVATLKDMGILNTDSAKRVMIVGVIGEIVSLFVLTLIEKVGTFHGWVKFLEEIGLILLFFFLSFVFFKGVQLLLWWYPELVRILTHEEDPSAVDIRLSFFLMFSASVLAHLFGLESVLGAFLAGTLISFFIRKKHDLEEKLSSIGYGFLIPIFFIETGMSMDLSLKDVSVLESVGTFLLLMLAIRLIPVPLMVASSSSWRESLMGAVFLSYPFTLMIAGIQISQRAGLIEDSTATALYITSALSSLLFPWMAKGMVKVLR